MTKISLSPHQQYTKKIYQGLIKNPSFTNALKTTAYILQQAQIPMRLHESRFVYILEENDCKREGIMNMACIEIEGLYFKGDAWSPHKNMDREHVRGMIIRHSHNGTILHRVQKVCNDADPSVPIELGLRLEDLAKAFYSQFQSEFLSAETRLVRNKIISRRL